VAAGKHMDQAFNYTSYADWLMQDHDRYGLFAVRAV
jgi:hypothetical protein